MTEALPYAGLVARHGLTASHWFMLDEIPDGAKVLDVGCASGYLAAALDDRGCEVHGVEPDPAMAEAAKAHCRTVSTDDIEDAAAREHLPKDLDVVVLGDVLEHLRDPWEVLQALAARTKSGGLLLVSVPNAVHWNARRHILRGRFPQESSGTFDRTHLRWFTQDTARDLARRAGLTVERERHTPAPLPGEAVIRRLIGGTAESPRFPFGHARWFLSRRFPRLFALQFVMTLRKEGTGSAATLTR